MRINMHLEEGKKEKGKEKTMIKQINKKKKNTTKWNVSPWKRGISQWKVISLYLFQG